MFPSNLCLRRPAAAAAVARVQYKLKRIGRKVSRFWHDNPMQPPPSHDGALVGCSVCPCPKRGGRDGYLFCPVSRGSDGVFACCWHISPAYRRAAAARARQKQPAAAQQRMYYCMYDVMATKALLAINNVLGIIVKGRARGLHWPKPPVLWQGQASLVLAAILLL